MKTHTISGNINKAYRNKLSNRTSVLVAYLFIPDPATGKERKSEFFKAYKRAIHHAIIKLILEDVKDWIDE